MHWFANTQALVNAVPGVVTIHDLRVFDNPVTFPQVRRLYLRLMMLITAKRAKILLPVSRSTASKLQNLLHVDPSRMVVVPVILPPNFVRSTPDAIAKFRAKYRLPNEFWLYVAHFYPHKNHIRLIYAYNQLKLSGVAPWPLILRGDPQGAETQVFDLITRLGLEDHIILLPRLNDQEMPTLYSAATALIFPSLYEGGGIPVVEAMACGCPVLASNIPAVQEFAGDAALYFDPTDIASICEAMKIFQNSPQKREACRHLGLVRAAEFRPERVINRLLQAYVKASGR
jgi:glycosyltransferase involved in cell wall biosynthesis